MYVGAFLNPRHISKGVIMKKSKARVLAICAMLSAVCVALQYLEISIPFVPEFIKLDFSDLPALIGSFSLGPVAGIAICLVKNVIKMLATYSAGAGELCNFILGAAFVGIAGLIYKRKKNIKHAILGIFAGAIISAIVSFPANYFITYPFYTTFMPLESIMGMYRLLNPKVETLAQALLWFNLPFTLFKNLLAGGICMLIYKRISPILKGK